MFCPGYTLCKEEGHPFFFKYITNDYLTLKKNDSGAPISHNVHLLYSWTKWVNNRSIIIMNRGVHHKDDPTTLREMKEVLNWIKQNCNSKENLVIFRTTPVAVMPVNMNFTRPLTKLERLNVKQKYVNESWHWESYDVQSYMIKYLIEKHYPFVKVMDVIEPMRYRLESNADGNHFCHPGVIDFWLEWFYNILKLQEMKYP